MIKLAYSLFCIILLCYITNSSAALGKSKSIAKLQNDTKNNEVMVTERGKMVVDEQSLVIENLEQNTAGMETVNDELKAVPSGGISGSGQQNAEAAQQKPVPSSALTETEGPRDSSAVTNGGTSGSGSGQHERAAPTGAQHKQGPSSAPTAAEGPRSLGQQEQPHVDKVEAGGTSPWIIVGSIFGGIGAGAIIVWIVISCVKRCQRNKCTTEEEEKPKSAEVPPEAQQTTTTSSSRSRWGLRGFSYTNAEFPKHGLFPVFSMEMPTPPTNASHRKSAEGIGTTLQAGMGFGTPRNNTYEAEAGELPYEDMKKSEAIIPSQAGWNKGDSQKLVTNFGTPSDVKGKHLKRIWELEYPEKAEVSLDRH